MYEVFTASLEEVVSCNHRKLTVCILYTALLKVQFVGTACELYKFLPNLKQQFLC